MIAAIKRLRLGDRLWWLLPLAFVAIVLLFFPFRFVFEFNPDEGLHLMRSLLQLRGHELYGDVYNDQPPLFTWLLSALFLALGLNVNLARLFVLSLSAGLMLAALAYLQENWGKAHVVGAWLLFLFLPKYTELSVSVMISLPAISLAMVSFYLLTRWHRTRSRTTLILSATALGLSVMVKIFTGILVPIFVLGILISEFRNEADGPWRTRIEPAALWSLVFLALVGLTALLAIGPQNLPQLVRVHLSALEADRYLQLSDTHNINYVLREARGILLLAVSGALVALKKREWRSIYLSTWGILGYGGLSLLLPVWAHHQLLVTVPAAILAAILIGETTNGLVARLRSAGRFDRGYALHLLGMIVVAVILASRVPPVLSELNPRFPNLRYTVRPNDIQQYKMLALMWKHADETEIVVTDRPMYAFRIEKPVPPQLAVISEKRLWSGAVTQEQIIEVIRSQRPEQVLLVRFPLEDVTAYLRNEYEVIYYLRRWRLFLRRDLVANDEERRLAGPIPIGDVWPAAYSSPASETRAR